MRTFLQIFLWSVALEGSLMYLLSPQGCVVPNHLFAFPLAPSMAVGIAGFRRCPVERVILLMLLAYLLALGARVGWLLTPWWSRDLGLVFGLVLVPVVMCKVIPQRGA